MARVGITVHNVNTGVDWQTATNQAGDFVVLNLPPGTYEFAAQRAGFRTYRKTGMVLEVGQTLRNDFRMELGVVAESISVTAEATPINTEKGASTGDVIMPEEINNLPLDGRDFMDLAFLVPGMAVQAESGEGAGMNVNGARGEDSNFYVDGFNSRNSRGGSLNWSPNLDALQEFKMETSGFSAEFGKQAGGVLQAALKSGTNQLHATLFEFVRNEFFDARAFFDQGKVPLRRNQFGTTFGGPVVLPKLYNGRNRTFFLVSWESYRQTLGQTTLTNVPTAAERSGDFSHSVNSQGSTINLKDPLASGNCTNTVKTACFPGNIVPSSRFSPVGLRLLSYYPLPNRNNSSYNYSVAKNNVTNWDSLLVKFDERLSPKDNIAFRSAKRYEGDLNPFAGSQTGSFGTFQDFGNSLVGLDYLRTFSPAMVGEAHLGYSRSTIIQSDPTFAGRDMAKELGIAGVTTDPKLVGFPQFTVNGFAQLGTATNVPKTMADTVIQLSGKLTWMHANHILKWGADSFWSQYYEPLLDNARGTFTFGTAVTTSPIADILLGDPSSTLRNSQGAHPYARQRSGGLFFNDDYKVTRSLTLNLGLRWDLNLPLYEKYGRMSNFVPGINKIVISSDKNFPDLASFVQRANLTDRVAMARDVGLPPALVYSHYKGFAPRFGFAWRPFGSQKTVLRGGYGIFYSSYQNKTVQGALMEGYPFSVTEQYVAQPTNRDAVTLANPFPPSYLSLYGTVNTRGMDVNAPIGYMQSWNLTTEREICAGMAVEADYMGSKGTHLSRDYDINQPLRTKALYMGGLGFPKPISGLGTVNFFQYGVNSIYNAGQVALRRRARGGLFFRIGYTYGKSIDEASQITGLSAGGQNGVVNPLDLKGERGRSDWDRGHVVTAAFSWDLPVGRAKRYFSGLHGVADGMFGGWQLAPGRCGPARGRP